MPGQNIVLQSVGKKQRDADKNNGEKSIQIITWIGIKSSQSITMSGFQTTHIMDEIGRDKIEIVRLKKEHAHSVEKSLKQP